MRRFQKENSFLKIEKKIEMNNIIEFPELSSVKLPLQDENKEKMNYVNASLRENEEDKKEVYLPGWSYLSMDNERKVKKRLNGVVSDITKFSDDQEEDIELLDKTEFNKKASKVISKMIENWENYKTWYIDLYGEDCYAKMYEMVRREDDIIYDDDDEQEEDENYNQDNTYTDEDEYDYY